MDHLSEDTRVLLQAAREIHAECHGAQTFTPGTHLPLQAAGHRTGQPESATLRRRHQGSGVRGRNRVGQECEIRQGG